MAFATTTDLANVLGREVDAEDPAALAALDAATAVVQAVTGQHLLAVAGDTITVDGSGTRVLLLPELPVTDVVSVSVDGTELDETEYQWSANGYLRRTNAVWPNQLRNIEVEYDHGYATIPALVVSITAKLAARMLDTPVNVKNEMIGAYNVSYQTPSLQADELVLLDRYKRL
jgi:hypothetical protein